jgi:sn-glycerol 3-phosphate transport system ATP-binding protein
MAAVSLKDVRKSYTPELQVIHGVNMEIADGEFIVILGPSGCGKSTLLRMVAGLETITAGEIAIGGRVVNNLEPKDRDIAMVFQNYALYPHMSVYDNMAYGLRIRGLSKSEIDTRVQKAAAILELAKYLDRRPRALSGGQRQRVAIARALVNMPSLILADEPTGNLDTANGNAVMELLINVAKAGTTVVMVTHSLTYAALAARTIKLLDGRIVSETLLAA